MQHCIEEKNQNQKPANQTKPSRENVLFQLKFKGSMENTVSLRMREFLSPYIKTVYLMSTKELDSVQRLLRSASPPVSRLTYFQSSEYASSNLVVLLHFSIT